MALIMTENGEKIDMWQGKFESLQDFANCIPDFYPFLQGALVVGHNISYDTYALDHTLGQIYDRGLYPKNLLSLSYSTKDTLRMSQRDLKRAKEEELILSPSPKKDDHSYKKIKQRRDEINIRKNEKIKYRKTKDVYEIFGKNKELALAQ